MICTGDSGCTDGYCLHGIPRPDVNKIENRITFKIKTGYYLELLLPETMKLVGSTEKKIAENKNGEIVPHLEIIELIFVQCNIVSNDYQRNSKVL